MCVGGGGLCAVCIVMRTGLFFLMPFTFFLSVLVLWWAELAANRLFQGEATQNP